MKTENLLHELSIRTGVKQIIWAMLGLSVAGNCFLALTLATKGTVVQTTLTPPEIRRSMTVSNIEFSKEYLEEMAPYAAFLLLNATPQTIEHQNSLLLKITDPEYKDALEKELKVNALWMKRNNISTYFTAVSAAADTSDNTVVLKGTFEAKKNNLIVDSRERSLLVSFRNNNGTLSLLSIKEIKTKTSRANAQETENELEPAVETEEVTVSNTVSDFKGGQ